MLDGLLRMLTGEYSEIMGYEYHHHHKASPWKVLYISFGTKTI
jgi:hypothetical protein